MMGWKRLVLSLVFGHFPYLTSKTVAMDKSYWAYVSRS